MDLWHDLDRLSTLLTESLHRTAGAALPQLSEEIRSLGRQDRTAAAARLRGIDVPEAVLLARGLGIQFQLNKVAEQVHRARIVNAERVARGGPIARVVTRALAAGRTQ